MYVMSLDNCDYCQIFFLIKAVYYASNIFWLCKTDDLKLNTVMEIKNAFYKGHGYTDLTELLFPLTIKMNNA